MHPFTPPVFPLAAYDRTGLLQPDLVRLFRLLGHACEPSTPDATLAHWTTSWAASSPTTSLNGAQMRQAWELLDRLGFLGGPLLELPAHYTNAVVLARTPQEARLCHRALKESLRGGLTIDDLHYIAGDHYSDGTCFEPDPSQPAEAILEVWEQNKLAGFNPSYVTHRTSGHSSHRRDLLWHLRRNLGLYGGSTLLIGAQPYLPARYVAAHRLLGSRHWPIQALGISAVAAEATLDDLLAGLAAWLLELQFVG